MLHPQLHLAGNIEDSASRESAVRLVRRRVHLVELDRVDKDGGVPARHVAIGFGELLEAGPLVGGGEEEGVLRADGQVGGAKVEGIVSAGESGVGDQGGRADLGVTGRGGVERAAVRVGGLRDKVSSRTPPRSAQGETRTVGITAPFALPAVLVAAFPPAPSVPFASFADPEFEPLLDDLLPKTPPRTAPMITRRAMTPQMIQVLLRLLAFCDHEAQEGQPGDS